MRSISQTRVILLTIAMGAFQVTAVADTSASDRFTDALNATKKANDASDAANTGPQGTYGSSQRHLDAASKHGTASLQYKHYANEVKSKDEAARKEQGLTGRRVPTLQELSSTQAAKEHTKEAQKHRDKALN